MKEKMTTAERMAQLQALQKQSNDTSKDVQNTLQSKTNYIQQYNTQLEHASHGSHNTVGHNMHDDHKVEKIGHTKGSCEIM